MRLIQFLDGDVCAVAAVLDERGVARRLAGATRVYDLALEAADSGRPLAQVVLDRLGAEEIPLRDLEDRGGFLLPVDHPDPARCWVTGTGLTHLGSASTRNTMHAAAKDPDAHVTDSMRMFQWGIEGGKPKPGQQGVQPEWFYKGDGTCLSRPGGLLRAPSFGLDIGEEPEIVGLYIIASDGTPCRIGFALGNEVSDHVMERQNYLYLAHSKLRPCSFGPELLLGDLPADITGRSRILRNGAVAWEKEFVTGEANMSHSVANLEAHHFKYDMFRRPGDLHCHFFGTGTLSFADGFRAEPGDVFEISAEPFGSPLRNTLEWHEAQAPAIRAL